MDRLRTRECRGKVTKIICLYLGKVVKLKATTGLPYAGLLPYLALVYLLRFRWLGLARNVGEFLQHLFSTNYSVNSALATVYSQLMMPQDECNTLMRIVPSNRQDIDLLARAGLSAAYAGDVISLGRLSDIAAQESLPLLSYLKGLSAYLSGQENYQSHFQESVKSFLAQNGVESLGARGKTMSILSMRHIGFEPNIPEFVRMSYNIRELEGIYEPLTIDRPARALSMLPSVTDGSLGPDGDSPAPVVLVSCDDGYLEVFADYFSRTLRRKNQNIIHFHVLAADAVAAQEFLAALNERHLNIRYSIEAISGKSQTYITLARYLICRDLIKFYNSDVLISDIDSNFNFDLRPICSELNSKNFDFGLCDVGYSVPWAKFAAGLSYFRVANHATDVFLELVSTYLTKMYSEGGFWTMDQTGILTAYECMQARGHDFRMLNLFGLIDFKRFLSVPKQLQRRKIKCKFRNMEVFKERAIWQDEGEMLAEMPRKDVVNVR